MDSLANAWGVGARIQSQPDRIGANGIAIEERAEPMSRPTNLATERPPHHRRLRPDVRDYPGKGCVATIL
jgi:hypothetical protein